MGINLQLPPKTGVLKPSIAVFGVGGAGGNAVNNMISSNLEGVAFVAANTDAQALESSLTDKRIQLGSNITQGLGAGANPEVGRAAAEESTDDIGNYLTGCNMVFVTAGMGGGTGTGAAPVIAQLAREQGILTVGVVTKPFHFEGARRMQQAEEGLRELQNYVDTLIVIPNQNLFRLANERTTFADAFKMADEVLHAGVRGVTDLMVMPGLINLDFADIRTVMSEMGKAMMGTGEAEGEKRAIEAAEAAISNPLLDDTSMKGARGVLINITGGSDMTLFEVDEAANRIREEVDADAHIIFGSTFNDGLEGKVRVSVVATGIESGMRQAGNGQGYNQTPGGGQPQQTGLTNPSVISMPQRQQGNAMTNAAGAPAPAARPHTLQNAHASVQTSHAPRAPFIPPRPVQANSAPVGSSAASQAPQAGSAHSSAENVERPATVQQAAALPEQPASSGGGLKFFQKVADVGRSLGTSQQPEGDRQPQAKEARAPQKKEAVTVGAPSPSEDDFLDIPAFLRRQTN